MAQSKGKIYQKVVFKRDFAQKRGLLWTKSCSGEERMHEIVVKLRGKLSKSGF